MKKLLILAATLILSNGVFANDFTILCAYDHVDTNIQQRNCPGLIEKALSKMGCGGEVVKCVLNSPGSPTSGVDCNVANSKCSLPKKDEMIGDAKCKDYKLQLDFRDYDDVSGYNGVFHTKMFQGMGAPVDFLCAPSK